MPIQAIRIAGDRFVDAAGRHVILRGVNLGGDSKLPYPTGGTHHPTDFADHRTVSFIGRPFPLAEADAHFARLRHWGFNLIRLLTTWEAVEHAGPGIYDEAYLEYLAEIAAAAGRHGLHVFIDFHQDAWSRMTGGDGAPAWTFEAVGLDFRTFPAAGAANVMQAVYDYADPQARQAAYPQMSWGSNYLLAANAIMWTLFWSGGRVTPDFQVGGTDIQSFLQGHYLGAVDQVARRLKDLPNVLGFDTLNEPSPGWMGRDLSYRHLGSSDHDPSGGRMGPAMTALEVLATAQGLPVTVPALKRDPLTAMVAVEGERVVNPDGVRIWAEGRSCPFEAAGVYRLVDGAPRALKEHVFRECEGRPFSMADDAFGPFFQAIAETIRAHNPDWALFAEVDVFKVAGFPAKMPTGSVNAGHWYDPAILYLKAFDPARAYDMSDGSYATSPDQIRARYVAQLESRAAAAKAFGPDGAPSLIGEFGIPFDLDHGAAYAAWADGDRSPDPWAHHVAALELMYDAMDALLLNSAQWNYTASNANNLRIGDGWNQEDLSIYSTDQATGPGDPDSGGRAVAGFCRPFVRAAQGRIASVRFRAAEQAFEAVVEADPTVAAPTEIYVPRGHFPAGFEVLAPDAARVEVAADDRLVHVWATSPGPLRIGLRARPGAAG